MKYSLISDFKITDTGVKVFRIKADRFLCEGEV